MQCTYWCVINNKMFFLFMLTNTGWFRSTPNSVWTETIHQTSPHFISTLEAITRVTTVSGFGSTQKRSQAIETHTTMFRVGYVVAYSNYFCSKKSQCKLYVIRFYSNASPSQTGCSPDHTPTTLSPFFTHVLM